VARPALLILAVLTLATLGLRSPATDVAVHRDTRAELSDVNLSAAVATAQEQAGGPDGLPTGWCGDERGDDDAGDAAWPAGSAQIKVVYAYPADAQDRFSGWRDALQADVAITQRFLSAQSGGRKGLRFDMGTRCGPGYADIQTVQLPGPRSQYVDDLPAIAQAVRGRIANGPGPRNTVILADGLSGSDVEYGLGETIMGANGEQAGPGNPHNRGGLDAVLFSRADDVPGAGAHSWWPEGFLHEITHTLGAVQWTAPHSTEPPGQNDPRYGHCWQGADVMCYAEDAGAAHQLVTDCTPIGGLIPESYDCGRDDYYSPDPPPGSYLATHWNTYDSAFMAACDELAPACGGGQLRVPRPPAAAAAPVVRGRVRSRATLTVTPGTWLNRPSGYRYQWQRLNGRRWASIARATRPRYTVGAKDLGRRLRATVVAVNADGAAAASSPQTAPVSAIALGTPERAAHKVRRGRR
jgi:hypothetical protein